MSEDLFSDFEEVSAKQWKQKIQYELKGADYNQTLVWKSNHGIAVNPFYHEQEAAEPISVPVPEHWNICERIYVASTEKANKKALRAIEKGAESLWFIIPTEEVDPKLLFEGIDLENFPVYISCEFLPTSFFNALLKMGEGQKKQLYLLTDIIGNLARSGNWFYNLNEDFSRLDKIFSQGEELQSVLSVNAALYQNAGANIPQQLAYAMAHATEYLNHLNNQSSISPERKRSVKILFSISAGSNYFFEIAKLRALRLLYATIAKEFDVAEDCFILAQPSKRNKTLYDYNLNLLRTTTESMSIALGGADSICNLPYDSFFHKENEFGSRIARNQLLILKEESYFEKAANPTEGSYYVESLTQQMAEKALEIFKDIENGGGFLKQLKEGTIQKKISESARKEQEQFDAGELLLVGSNKYMNKDDKMKAELELYPFLKKHPRKTLLSPILERRLSEKMEQERLKEEEKEAVRKNAGS